MAAYPTSVGYRVESITPITKRKYKATESGTVRGSAIGTGDVYRIVITHPYITSSELATLQTFYDTNKHNNNTIAPDGDTYNVNFEGDYTRERINATYFHATVSLIGTRQ